MIQMKVLQDRVETLEEKHEFIEQHGLLFICVYIYATKVLAHETWNTGITHSRLCAAKITTYILGTH